MSYELDWRTQLKRVPDMAELFTPISPSAKVHPEASVQNTRMARAPDLYHPIRG